MTIERDADDIARCFLLARGCARLAVSVSRRRRDGVGDAAFEGEIVGVIGAGAFDAFGETASIEGCCRSAACATTGGS